MTWAAAVRDLAWLRDRVLVNPATGCWEWQLARTKLGYGHYGETAGGHKHVTRKAHRLAFELKYGFAPPVVMHRCDNPPCCNPAHLQAGDLSANVQDMLDKSRSTMQKLTREQVEEIRTALTAGTRGAALARLYGVDESTISRIKRGVSWRPS